MTTVSLFIRYSATGFMCVRILYDDVIAHLLPSQHFDEVTRDYSGTM